MPDSFGSDVWAQTYSFWLYVNDMRPFGLLIIAGIGVLVTMGVIRLVWEAFS